MKITSLIASVMTAAFLAPAVCIAQDAPPPQDVFPPSQHRGGPGGPHEGFQLTPEVKKLLEEYKAKPSDDLKAQLKAKLEEAFDKFLKERTEQLQKEKEKIEKLQADREKEIDSRLEKLLSGKQDDQKGKGKLHKPSQQD